MSIARRISFNKSRVLITVLLLFWLTAANATDDVEKNVVGRWKLIAARDAAAIASLDERGARRLIGKIFTIRRDKVKFGNEICGPSDFEAQIVEVRLFLPQEFRATPENLGLSNPATAVDLSCTTVFIKSANQLLIFWDGWFFDAIRVR